LSWVFWSAWGIWIMLINTFFLDFFRKLSRILTLFFLWWLVLRWKLSTLVNAWCWPPPAPRSWWTRWGDFGS
jgi:hypothetical protein